MPSPPAHVHTPDLLRVLSRSDQGSIPPKAVPDQHSWLTASPSASNHLVQEGFELAHPGFAVAVVHSSLAGGQGQGQALLGRAGV